MGRYYYLSSHNKRPGELTISQVDVVSPLLIFQYYMVNTHVEVITNSS